jgi:hypothetical protein
MVVTRRYHHDILLCKRISETTVIPRGSRRFPPFSDNSVRHSSILGKRDMDEGCV